MTSLFLLDCLQTRQAFTPEQINDHCYVDMNSNKAVFDSLRNNPKVHYDGKRFSYKVTLSIMHLQTLIDWHTFGSVIKSLLLI